MSQEVSASLNPIWPHFEMILSLATELNLSTPTGNGQVTSPLNMTR